MANFEIKWHGDEAKAVILKAANARLGAAGKHLQKAIKINISIPTRSAKNSKTGKAIQGLLP